MKCVPEYCPVQQRWVVRLSLLCSAVATDRQPIVTLGASGDGQLNQNARRYCGASSNGPLMSECPLLLWALVATMRVSCVQQ
jgi:hypothetical protein